MPLIEGQDWGWRLDRRVTDTTLRQVFQSLQRYLSGKDEEVTYDIRDLNNAVAAAKQAAEDANTAATTALGAAQDALDAASDASGDAATALSAAQAAQTAASNAEATAQAASNAAADALLAAADAEASAVAAEATATTALAAAQDAEDAAADAFDAATSASSAAATALQAAADAQAAADQAQAAADAAQQTADGAQSTADDAIAGLGTLQDEVDDILPITELKIAPDAVTAPKIAANAVVAGKIAANAVTADAMAAMNIGVGKHIRSTSYDPGVDGWSIDADGSAEFNDVTVRGSITGSEITGSTITGGRFQTAETGPRVVVDAGEESRGIRWPSDEPGEENPAQAIVSHIDEPWDPYAGTSLVISSPDFGYTYPPGQTYPSERSSLRLTYSPGTQEYSAILAGNPSLLGHNVSLISSKPDGGGHIFLASGTPNGAGEFQGDIDLYGHTRVNGSPIGVPPLILSNSANRQFNVADNTWTLFPPFAGTTTIDSENPYVKADPTLAMARFTESGLYEVSGVFGLRTHGNQTSTLVLGWFNATLGATSRAILTAPFRPTLAQDTRVPFGPVAFRVSNTSHLYSFRGRHISDDSASHYMWLDELTVKRIG